MKKFLQSPWSFIVLFALVFAGLYPYVLDKKIDTNGDNMAYWLIGDAMAKGQPLTEFAQNFSEPVVNHFPPGYPALLAVNHLFLGADIYKHTILNGFLLLASVILVYFTLIKMNFSRLQSGIVGLLCLTNVHLLQYAGMLMSEIPYLFFVSLAFFLLIQADLKSQTLGDKPWLNYWLLALIPCLSVAHHIRTIGVATAASIVLYFAIKKHWKSSILVGLGYALSLLPWMNFSKTLGKNDYIVALTAKNPYNLDAGTASFADFVERFTHNLSRYINLEIPSAVFSGMPVEYSEGAEVYWTMGFVILAICSFGLYKLPQYKILLGAYFAGNFAILLLWPEQWFGVRFMLGTIPFVLALFAYGIWSILDLVKTKLSFGIPHVVILLMVYGSWAGIQNLHAKTLEDYQPQWKAYFEVAKWAKANTPEGTVFCARSPFFFYYFSERPTAKYKFTENDQELLAHLKEYKVKYVVLEHLGFGSTYRYLLPAMAKNQLQFPMVLHMGQEMGNIHWIQQFQEDPYFISLHEFKPDQSILIVK